MTVLPNCSNPNTVQFKFNNARVTQETLEQNIFSFEELIQMKNKPEYRYNIHELVEASGYVEQVYRSIIPKEREKYPTLEHRFEQGRINPYEIADFLEWSGYTIEDTKELQLGKIQELDNYYTQLDFYYDQNLSASISGGFCSAFSNMLDQINSLSALQGNIAGKIQSLNLGSKAAQLMSIKDMILRLIDSLKGLMLKQIQNLKGNVEPITSAALGVINKKATAAESQYSDENVNGLKDRIESLIASIAGSYEDLTPELIAYLLYRLCILIQSIQDFFRQPTYDFRDFIKAFNYNKSLLISTSNKNRRDAIDQGYYRIDSFEAVKIRQGISRNINQQNDGIGKWITEPISDEEFALIRNMTDQGNKYIKWAPSVLNMGSDVHDANKGDGWKKLEPEVVIRAMRIAKRMNATLYINSAYRSPQYNANISGSASRSLHMSGLAIDVSMTNSPGLSNSSRIRDEFIRVASQEGFKGIGTYNTFIHIDLREGGRATWGSQNQQALNNHKMDRYRKG